MSNWHKYAVSDIALDFGTDVKNGKSNVRRDRKRRGDNTVFLLPTVDSKSEIKKLVSDASVILSPKERDQLLTCSHPLQTEVYNTSGTDARAFPVLGNTMPVLALLLATRGNHSPIESIHKKDLEDWAPTLAEVATHLLAR
jgi:putative aminopeptidase FrvX